MQPLRVEQCLTLAPIKNKINYHLGLKNNKKVETDVKLGWSKHLFQVSWMELIVICQDIKYCSVICEHSCR